MRTSEILENRAEACLYDIVCELLSRVRLRDPMDCSPPIFSAMGFSGQEYWSGLPFPSPRDLSNPGIEPWSPEAQVDSLPFELQGDLFYVTGGVDYNKKTGKNLTL